MEQPPENLIQTIQDMLSTCIDGLCEVLTEDNRMLFVGRLEQYDPKEANLPRASSTTCP